MRAYSVAVAQTGGGGGGAVSPQKMIIFFLDIFCLLENYPHILDMYTALTVVRESQEEWPSENLSLFNTKINWPG